MSSRLPTDTTPGQWCFKIVACLDDQESELKARFIDDASPRPVSASLDRAEALQYLSFSLRRSAAIGVLFGEDSGILDLGTLICAEVLEVGESTQYPHLSSVELGGEAAPRYLSKHHARYEGMLGQLTEAATTQTLVWCVLQGSTIVDVKVLSGDENDILCRWMRDQGQHAEEMRTQAGRQS
jgi:hypothetical protein